MCLFLTCVVEEGGNEGAVLEEGVAGGDVLKVTLLEQRVLKHHRPHFQVHKPARMKNNSDTETKRQHKDKEGGCKETEKKSFIARVETIRLSDIQILPYGCLNNS